MKKRNKKIGLKGLINPLVRTCRVCSFKFKPYNPKTRKKISVCPICGHNFIESHIIPKKPK